MPLPTMMSWTATPEGNWSAPVAVPPMQQAPLIDSNLSPIMCALCPPVVAPPPPAPRAPVVPNPRIIAALDSRTVRCSASGVTTTIAVASMCVPRPTGETRPRTCNTLRTSSDIRQDTRAFKVWKVRAPPTLAPAAQYHRRIIVRVLWRQAAWWVCVDGEGEGYGARHAHGLFGCADPYLWQAKDSTFHLLVHGPFLGEPRNLYIMSHRNLGSWWSFGVYMQLFWGVLCLGFRRRKALWSKFWITSTFASRLLRQNENAAWNQPFPSLGLWTKYTISYAGTMAHHPNFPSTTCI